MFFAFVLFLAVGIGLIWIFQLFGILNLAQLKSQKDVLLKAVEIAPLTTVCIYTLTYALCAALAIPVATLLTIAAGAVFGFGAGVSLVAFASSVGATLSFLGSRYLFREMIHQKFPHQISRIKDGLKNNGIVFLFGLRMTPLFPFFLVNLLMGLTSLPTLTFIWVSALGMLPAIFIYVHAGTELAQIDTIQSILKPSIFFAFSLMGIFPIATKILVRKLKS